MEQPSHDQPGATPEAARVADTLARIRAGVRRRHAWTATMSESARLIPSTLAQVQAAQQLQEPVPTSHRGLVGRPLVFAKKVVYRLFMRWYMRAIVEQQTAFNRAVTTALQDLHARQLMLAEALADDSCSDDRSSAALPR
jgi:hypothetical protein